MAAKKKSSKKTPTKAKVEGAPSKSDFIREKLKTGMSAAEIVKTAAEQKIVIAPALIYKLKSKIATGGAKKTSTTKSVPKAKDGKLTASGFVRRHPEKSAGQIVELAKKAGVKVTSGLVYTTRAYDKKKSGGTAPKGKPGPKSKTPALAGFPGTGGGSDADLKKAALAVGFPRALQVVAELGKKFEAVEKQYRALLG